jgi:hypothetical protein
MELAMNNENRQKLIDNICSSKDKAHLIGLIEKMRELDYPGQKIFDFITFFKNELETIEFSHKGFLPSDELENRKQALIKIFNGIIIEHKGDIEIIEEALSNDIQTKIETNLGESPNPEETVNDSGKLNARKKTEPYDPETLAKFSGISQATWSRAFNDVNMLKKFEAELTKKSSEFENIIHDDTELSNRIQRLESKKRKSKELSYDRKRVDDEETDFSDIPDSIDAEYEAQAQMDVEKIRSMDKKGLKQLLISDFEYSDEDLENKSIKYLRTLALQLVSASD